MALFAIGIFLLSCKVCSSHYIVFEDVGQVATSLTYLHVTIPLNFTDIDDLILQYRNAILEAKVNTEKYKVIPILEYLYALNAKIKANQ